VSCNSFFLNIDSSDSPTNETEHPSCVVSPDLASRTAPNVPLQGMFSIPEIHPNTNVGTPMYPPASFPGAPQAPGPLTAPPTSTVSLQGIAPVAHHGLPQQMTGHQHKRQRLASESKSQQPVQLSAHLAAPAVARTQQLTPQIRPPAPEEAPDSPNQSGKTGRQKSQAQVDRRRERNRILARRTRLRKKFFFESLQKEVMDLQKENMALKEIVRTSLDAEQAKLTLDNCKVLESLPEAVLEHCGDPSNLGAQDFNLMTSIRQSQQCFIITDPSLHDNPIVYASDDFLTLTGYNRDEVLGRNCRFLQGTDTDQQKVDGIRKAIANGEDVSVIFVNYKADGTAFWNKLFIAALRDAQNNIVNYIGVNVKVAGPDPDDPEAGKDISNGGVRSRSASADGSDESVDADAAVMAIESAVEQAVAAAPIMTNSVF
jgi:PAS domain S-box-containing protein